MKPEDVIAKVPCPICNAGIGSECTKVKHDLAAGNVHHVRIHQAELKPKRRVIRRR